MNIYSKIYRLYKKDVDPQKISLMTNIPLKMIKSIIYKFEHEGEIDYDESHKTVAPFLDISSSKLHKHVILDLSGMLVEKFIEKIKEALEEAERLTGFLVAIKLESVLEVDKAAMDFVIKFKEDIAESTGRVVVLLSPNEEVENYIQTNKIDDKIKIFGTQSSFEDYVFRNIMGLTTKGNRHK